MKVQALSHLRFYIKILKEQMIKGKITPPKKNTEGSV